MKFNKLFALFFLLPVSVAFSQVNKTNNSLLIKYNDWLKSVKLDAFLLAAEIKSESSVTVLVLKPSATYADPADLAVAWNYIRNGFKSKRINIYQVLLDKFSAYSAIPLNKLGVDIKTTQPRIFSVKVNFDDKVRYTEKIDLPRGINVTPDFNIEAPAHDLLIGDYTLIADINDLTAYSNKFEHLFKQFKNFGETAIKCENLNSSRNFMKFKLSNIYGEITKEKYHEIVTITITLTDRGNRQVEIEYNMDVLYAAGILRAPTDINSYRDASIDYPGQLADYNIEFLKKFKMLFP